MFQYNLTATQPAALLVSAGDGPTLIVNNDPTFTLWLGDNNAITNLNPVEAIPVAPNGYLGVDGTKDVYGVADVSATNYINVLVIAGGMSFFQFLSQLVIIGSAAGLFIYSPLAGFGTLIGSWSAVSGVDKYGNPFPAGINVFQGQLSGVSISNATIISSIINQAIITGPQISAAAISGGTMTETTVTFDSTGGLLVMYASTTTTVTQTANGTYTFNVPSSVNVSDVSVWGPSAGGGGGNAGEGGESGGGGGFSRNPNYPLIPGNTITYIVGNGGTGGNTGQPGTDGDDFTIFDTANNGVVAFGGTATQGPFLGGLGGPANPSMPISFAGGNGANGSGTASAGGGSSAGTASNGNNGNSSVGSTPGFGGSAPVGGGVGANGVAPATNGNGGGSPGGGGSGAGAATTSTQVNKTYSFGSSATYYGSDATGGNANGKKSSTPSDGTMWQGGETASGGSFNGTMKSLGIISGNPQSDFSGVTIDQVTLRFTNTHTWYNSGGTLYMGHNPRTSLPSSWDGSDITLDKSSHIGEGSTATFDLSASGLGAALKSGAAKAITLGPGSGSFNLTNYASQTGSGGGGNTAPLLTVKGHTGSTTVRAGNGADGKVSFTYTTGTSLVAGASPIATVDSFGNALAAGFTGPITAIHPGSNPATVEGWQNVTPPTGWSGTCRYKLLAESKFGCVDFQLTNAGTSGNVSIITLPSAYRPSIAHAEPFIVTSTGLASPLQRVTVNTDGTVVTSSLIASTTTIAATVIYPLD